jgi:hypothetical protein
MSGYGITVEEEAESLRSQFATSNRGRGGRRYRPYAFTEYGAIMAANVLNSTRTIHMSVYVVRAFVRLREILVSNRMLGEKRNRERFPDDFIFQLNKAEFANLKSQLVTSSWGGLRRAAPYAFTEQGVAMLSSVLKSRRAIQVNITIMRTFVQLRELAATHKELAAKLAELERKVAGHDGHIHSLFEAIRQLMSPPPPPGRRIGFEVKFGDHGRLKRRRGCPARVYNRMTVGEA